MTDRERMYRMLMDKLDYLTSQPDLSQCDIGELDAVLTALGELDPLPDVPAIDVEEGLRRLHETLKIENKKGMGLVHPL